VAETAGVSWAAFPDGSGYPTKFYTSLTTAAGAANVHPPSRFIPMAKAGELPQVCYVWSPSGFDEHPPFTNDPAYVSKGHDLVWQRVLAVIDGGGWPDTTFILTWDDWGGYTDFIRTPDIETAVDALHPDGFQIIGGSRIPLLMFGGKVAQGIDPTWHSHASIPKTIIDLLGLPAMGVPRVDTAPSLAGRVDPNATRPLPPAYGTVITQPPPPTPTPVPVDPGAWPGSTQAMPGLVTLDGTPLAAPADAVVRTKPPKPPKPPVQVPVTNLDALVDSAYAGKTATELAAAPLDALKGLTATNASALKRAVGISTIGELASNKFVHAAQTITTAQPGHAS
jgi:Phosphoesterase family